MSCAVRQRNKWDSDFIETDASTLEEVQCNEATGKLSSKNQDDGSDTKKDISIIVGTADESDSRTIPTHHCLKKLLR